MVLLVALVVVGPERLPGLVRTVGLWVGKARRFAASVKAEIDQELVAEKLKKTLDQQNAMGDVYEIIDEARQVTSDIKQDINRPVEETRAQASTPAGTGSEKQHRERA